jgi:hypothetical protein
MSQTEDWMVSMASKRAGREKERDRLAEHCA